MDKKTVNEHLIKTFCYKCGKSLDGARIVPISEMPIAITAHVTCPNCKAESMVTITLAGSGVLPVVTDLIPTEIKDFFGQREVTTDDILDLHIIIKKGQLWNLLQPKELNLAKKAERLEKTENSQP